MAKDILNEKDVETLSLRIIRYLCQQNYDTFTEEDIYQHSGIKDYLSNEISDRLIVEDTEYKEVFKEVIANLIEKGFLNYTKTDDVQDKRISRTSQLTDICGKLLTASIKGYDSNIL